MATDLTSHDNVTDIVERLRALHVWPQFVADEHADVILPRQLKALYDVGHVAHEAADTIATLRKQLENAREVIIEANNSLYGSQGYFLSLNGGPPNKYHLAEGIEELKSNVRRLGISGWHFAKGMVCHDPQ